MSVIYRQPDNSTNGYPSKFAEFQEGMVELKSKILDLEDPTPDIIIGGDFNLPHIAWPLCIPKQASYPEEPRMVELLDQFSQELHLTQHINQPTHKYGSVLHLILTNNDDLILTYNIIGNPQQHLTSFTH